MSERDSNIGQEGVESIRIKGKQIQDLPLGQGNQAKEQLPAAIETARLNKIAGINAKYPTHRVDYLNSRINECRENIDRIKGSQAQQAQMISDYKGHIALCKHRDRELSRLQEMFHKNEINPDELAAKRKQLKKDFPLYDVDAMLKQIVQCEEAIERCNDVIKQENDSIEEFTEVLTLCRQRDKELKQWGAVAEGS